MLVELRPHGIMPIGSLKFRFRDISLVGAIPMETFLGHVPSVGPEEVDPAEPGAAHVPVRALPRLQQGGQGQQRQGQVPLQDEDDGEWDFKRINLVHE